MSESPPGKAQFNVYLPVDLIRAGRQHDGELQTHPILRVNDSVEFAPDRAVDFAQPFTLQHWGVVEALIRDPDGREVSLQAPVPDNFEAIDADAHHHEKYGGA